MITILETENKDWGFWGSGKNYLKHKKDITKLWNETAKLIQKNSRLTPEETEKLMDSRWGRHTADSNMEDFSTYVASVDEHAYPNPIPQKYHDFCKELEKLSRKYGIVIQAVGGVRFSTEDFNGYNPDLDSGDLIPEWKD